MDKREERYWKKFEHSGKIEDYLSLVSDTRIREGDYAGTYICDGDHIEAVPGGGIRQTYQPFN